MANVNTKSSAYMLNVEMLGGMTYDDADGKYVALSGGAGGSGSVTGLKPAISNHNIISALNSVYNAAVVAGGAIGPQYSLQFKNSAAGTDFSGSSALKLQAAPAGAPTKYVGMILNGSLTQNIAAEGGTAWALEKGKASMQRLEVSGALIGAEQATFSKGLQGKTIEATATLAVTGAANFGSTVQVDEQLTASKGIQGKTIEATATLAVTGAANFGSTVQVDEQLTASKGIQGKTIEATGTLAITGASNFGSTVQVDDQLTASKGLQGKTIEATGNLSVTGNSDFAGKAIFDSAGGAGGTAPAIHLKSSVVAAGADANFAGLPFICIGGTDELGKYRDYRLQVSGGIFMAQEIVVS